jgi:hypothetical protein
VKERDISRASRAVQVGANKMPAGEPPCSQLNLSKAKGLRGEIAPPVPTNSLGRGKCIPIQNSDSACPESRSSGSRDGAPAASGPCQQRPIRLWSRGHVENTGAAHTSDHDRLVSRVGVAHYTAPRNSNRHGYISAWLPSHRGIVSPSLPCIPPSASALDSRALCLAARAQLRHPLPAPTTTQPLQPSPPSGITTTSFHSPPPVSPPFQYPPAFYRGQTW